VILAVTLSALLSAMKAADRGQWEPAEKVLGYNLNGYGWTRDFAISSADKNLRAVVIARMGGSYIYTFQSEKLIAKMPTPGEVLSVELFDFDADQRDEIITVQKTGWGTGIYHEEFIIYSASLKQLWRATSYWYADVTGRKQDFEMEEGFIRSAAQRLQYVSMKDKAGKRTRSRKFFKFDGKHFVPAREEP